MNLRVVSPATACAWSIADLLRRRAVIAKAIGLDDKAEVGPEEVDAEAMELNSRLRSRQAGPSNETEKSPLQRGVRQAEDLAIKEAEHGGNAGLPAPLHSGLP